MYKRQVLHSDAQQPGSIHVTLWDADFATYAEQFDMHGCSRLFPFDNGAAPNIPIQAVMGMNEELAAKGYIQKADTLEELAGKLGLPADALIATVERNNENYDNQVDPDFGKEPFRLSPVRNPPFYGIRNTGMLLCTMDGININTQGQALDVYKRQVQSGETNVHSRPMRFMVTASRLYVPP